MMKKSLQQGRNERKAEEVHTAPRAIRLPLECAANG